VRGREGAPRRVPRSALASGAGTAAPGLVEIHFSKNSESLGCQRVERRNRAQRTRSWREGGPTRKRIHGGPRFPMGIGGKSLQAGRIKFSSGRHEALLNLQSLEIVFVTPFTIP
jgi:hypothetical protein